MSFVAAATHETSAAPERVFDTLTDHDAWDRWMPSSFRPAGRSVGALRPGARLRVRIAASRRLPLPAILEVTVAERPRTITWCGGLRGVLFAEHRFHFDHRDGGGTRIRSEETWTGRLARVLERVVRPLAEKVGKDQIEALARAAESRDG